jgi:hypothetical protein
MKTRRPAATRKAQGYKAWNKRSDGSLLFVSALPGEQGADWGFGPIGSTFDPARILSTRDAVRFLRYQIACGKTQGKDFGFTTHDDFAAVL